MKKIFSFLAVALLALGFTACEDVPAPYGIEDEIIGDGSKVLPFVQSFENSLGGYTNYTLTGEGRWINDHKAAVASGYNSADQSTTAGSYILVSPEISLVNVENAHFVMEYVLRYFKTAENQQVWITKTFDANQAGEGWTEIPVTLESVNDWNDVKSIDVNIPEEFVGSKVRLALYYNTPASKGSTWQVKSLSVLEGTAEGGENKPEEGGVRELPYAESFATDFGGFVNYTTSGAGAWKIDFGTAKASGYDFEAKKNTAGIYYLVSPEISLKDQKEVHLTYDYILAYMSRFPNGNKLFITDNFDANNAAQNWTEIPVSHKESVKGADGKIDWKTFNKMDVQVPAEFLGKTIRVAFYHECDDKGSTTMELKNFKIETGKAEEGGNTPDVKPEGDAIFSAAMTSSLDGMVNYLGTSEWTWGFDSNYNCAKVSGHVGGKEGHKVAGVAYLVTPEISLENVTEAHVAYESAIGYMSVPENHQLMINANFNESAPEEGWVVLQNKHDEGEKFFTWINYDLQIPADMVGKKVRIGFRYECSAEKASTWELKNLKVLAGKANGGHEGGNEGGGNTPDTGDVEASNGNFETWVDGLPNNWKSVSTASSAKLSQSTDAHSGQFSVCVAGDPKSNKRLAYKELNLKAGDYTMKFFVKAATSAGGSARPAYVIVPESGKLNGDCYQYGDYVNDLSSTEWKEVTHKFTIEADGTFCMAIMNPQNPGKDILIDDFTLTDAAGNAIIK